VGGAAFSMQLELTASELRRIVSRFQPTTEKMEAIGFFCLQQSRSRFEQHGGPGVPWPTPKWLTKIGRDDGRALLTGKRGDLLRSFHSSGTEDTAILGSDSPYAAIHQLGTVGAAGSKPDIRPKKAKALWVPISDKAQDIGPVKTASSMRRESDLIRGAIVNGKLVPPNCDYVFLRRVKIAPRPMLPNSEAERAEQGRFVTETLKS
jgi:phage gpG-like protein